MHDTRKLLVIVVFLLLGSTLPDAAEIHDAVNDNDIKRVKELLKENPSSLNAQDDQWMTPLNIAVFNGNTEIVNELLERGADLSIGDIDGSQPIHCAAINGSIEIVQLLRKKGASINDKDDNGATPLSFATARRRLDMVRYLLENDADVNSRNAVGMTPLFLASTPEIAELLIENGARVDIRNDNNSTPLHMIAGAGSVETAELLLAHGLDINAMNDFGWTPLSNAAFRNAEITQFLISRGAKVNPHRIEQKEACTCHAEYQTPLHCAVRRDSLNIVRLLVENGAVINITDNDEMTPLHIAVSDGNSAITEYLLSQNAQLNIKENHWGRTELHTAAINGYDDIVELLVNKGADVNAQDIEGKTSLDHTLHHGFDSITSFLIAHGATKKSRDISKSTSTHLKKELNDKEAIIWHLGHSGWAIKTQHHLLIFDYFTDRNGPLPTDASLASGYIVPDAIKDENVTVFVTHHHTDHYDPTIFEWQNDLPKIEYVLGFQPSQIDNEYTLIGPHTERALDDMKVTTIRSNDTGVGFLVEVDGLVIFHAGDHANGFMDMSGTYTPEIDALADKNMKIDLAFFPIVGCRLGTPESVQLGVHYAIEKLNPTIVLPMHARDATYRYREFAEEAATKGYTTQITYATSKGDRFLFADSKITTIE
ncbi:hypothetical protein AMJ83_06195 [candidate division WOR_3 bacterium SM23_42]|uniref:Uncharacterized protein n=1 Tax=candidate division WOR_3 bacterium SM23_42 TaxID=1703779 RepID=A0A0S8FVF8_UNCW3|nr:MAG: hypothetical protein AMJ83_06195 [candidate division WOR_3 bacterium SM23_42]